ncbi:MAG: D-inositol-3-phosphate glycosyltransferase [Thermoleophilaceae bacterium]|nr:D-inositol-3-phosphate glycosyltransferase [Thermoleophilaceae bacterium]
MPNEASRIVFVSAHTGLGGAEGYLDRLVQRLPQEQRGPAVFLGDGPAADRLESHGIQVIRLPRGRRWRALTGLPLLRRNLLELDPTLVHAHGIFAATTTALALLFTRVPILWLKVDFTGDGAWSNLLALRCRMVVGISRAVVEGLWRPVQRRTRAVHCGIPEYEFDRDQAREEVLAMTGWPAESEIVLVSGRIASGKGQIELVEAAPRIAQARPNARFLLLGSEDPFHPGYADSVVERVEALGLGARLAVQDVAHDGEDPAFEAVRVAAGSNVVVVPSVRERPRGWREGFGLVGAEAFSVGTPVVAYRNGSLPEVLGDCARMVDEGDREGLADGVIEILSDAGLRERMSTCGGRLVKERYRMDRAVQQMTACYLEAAARRPS